MRTAAASTSHFIASLRIERELLAIISPRPHHGISSRGPVCRQGYGGRMPAEPPAFSPQGAFVIMRASSHLTRRGLLAGSTAAAAAATLPAAAFGAMPFAKTQG